MAQSEKAHGVDNAQLILETIDQLRKRKARPDKERICHMLQRRHGVSLEATAADLERLVDAEVVVKVDYKGNTSYRNAAKWRKSHMGHVLNSNEVQALIRQAVVAITGYQEGVKKEELRPQIQTDGAPPNSTSAQGPSSAPVPISTTAATGTELSGDASFLEEKEDPALAEKKLFINITPIENIEQQIIKQEGHPQVQQRTESLLAIKQERGAAFVDIEVWLRERDPATSLTGKQLFMALKREVDAGRLAKQPHDGTYIIGSGIPLPKKSPAKSNKLTVKDLLSPPADGGDVKFAPGPGGDGKKWTTDKDGSPKEKVKKPPKKKARKSHGDESMGGAGGGRTPSECSSISPHEGARGSSTSSIGKGRKSTTSISSRTPSPMQAITIVPAMPVQLSPGGPYIVPNDGELRCDFCLLTALCNRNGRQEELLFCKDCQAKAHPSCMDYSEDLAARARTSPWQCIDCKTCYICEDSGDPVSDDAMLFCDACDKGYHMDCHNPPVEEKPTGKWVCSKCVLELGVDSTQQMELDIDREVSHDSISTSTTDGPSCLPTPGNSPVPMHEGAPDQNANTVKTEVYKHKKESPKRLSPIPMMNGHINPPLPRLSETLPLEVPDASEWSIDDVVNYFLGVGFTEQAEVFKEQEIDGKSLLLMKRSDVLTGLSLKLGPALKIYTHIQRLQTMGYR